MSVLAKQCQCPGISGHTSNIVDLFMTSHSTNTATLDDSCAQLISAADGLSILGKASCLKMAEVFQRMLHSSPAFHYKFLPLTSY